MRIRLPSFPYWLPARVVYASSALFLLVAIPSLAAMHMDRLSSQELEESRRHAADQKSLAPIIADLRAKRAVLEKQVALGEVLPAPADLPSMMKSLQKLTDASGVKSSQFMPVSESVLKNGGIRINGRFMASSDNFRRLLLALSDQPWVTDIASCAAKAGANLPEFELTLFAAFRQGGEAKP